MRGIAREATRVLLQTRSLADVELQRKLKESHHKVRMYSQQYHLPIDRSESNKPSR